MLPIIAHKTVHGRDGNTNDDSCCGLRLCARHIQSVWWRIILICSLSAAVAAGSTFPRHLRTLRGRRYSQ